MPSVAGEPAARSDSMTAARRPASGGRGGGGDARAGDPLPRSDVARRLLHLRHLGRPQPRHHAHRADADAPLRPRAPDPRPPPFWGRAVARHHRRRQGLARTALRHCLWERHRLGLRRRGPRPPQPSVRRLSRGRARPAPHHLDRGAVVHLGGRAVGRSLRLAPAASEADRGGRGGEREWLMRSGTHSGRARAPGWGSRCVHLDV
mmetsp:Transcript_17779/g.58470  ORF Transcript_17779/g.58470 Transcript_17779/m.58470 type:complete len:205 (-) Transcript_17779:153-767(-)